MSPRKPRTKLPPVAPIAFKDLRSHLTSLGVDRLAEIAWIRAQSDEILSRTLMVSATARLPNLTWDTAKAAIDHAIHFPDFVRYTDDGHGAILSEIQASAEYLIEHGNRDLALRVARYAIELGESVTENFEEGFDWTSSLDDLSEWAQRIANQDRPPR